MWLGKLSVRAVRWLTAGSTIGLVTGAMVLVAARNSASLAAQTTPTPPESPVAELAERLLVQPFAPNLGLTSSGQIPSVELLVEQVPVELPLTVPVPPGGRLVGSAVRRAGSQVIGIDVVDDAPGAPADLAAFYTQALSGQGWTVLAAGQRPVGGFQTVPTVGTGSFCPPDGTGTLTMTTFLSGTNQSTARVTFNPTTYGPCGASPPRAGLPPNDLLPVLTAPEGVVLQQSPGGSFFSPQGAASNATAETDLSAAALEAAFAPQLEAAGWIRQAGDTDGPMAWSTWTVPREGDWHGMLFVLATPGTNRRFLYVRAESTSGPSSPLGSVGGAAVIGSYPGSAPVPVSTAAPSVPPASPLSIGAPPPWCSCSA